MILQILVSNFADSHANIQLKKIVSVFYIIGVFCCAILWLLPIPIAMIIIVYSIAAALQGAVSGLVSAVMMQFANIGLKVNFGWPRGIGSIGYALSAFILGIVVERYSPDILMPIFVVLTVIAIISVISMPNPSKLKRAYHLQSTEDIVREKRSTTYLEMLRSNPTLILFLCASVISFMGQSPLIVFLIRIVESVGGSNQELGISMLIQSGIELPIMFASVWILSRFKLRDILVFSFFCYFIKSLALYFAPNIGSIYGIMFFSIFCMGIYGFASVLFANSIVKPWETVRAQSLVFLSMGLGLIIGSYLSGYIVDAAGVKPMMMASWIVLLSASFIMVACHRIHARNFPAKS